MYPFAIDTSPITDAITDLGSAGGAVIAAGLVVAVALFGVPFLWKRAKKIVGS